MTDGDLTNMQEVHDKLNDVIRDFSSKYEFCKESIGKSVFFFLLEIQFSFS